MKIYINMGLEMLNITGHWKYKNLKENEQNLFTLFNYCGIQKDQ